MKDNFITVDGWDWSIDDPARLEPWFSIRQIAEEKFLVRKFDSTVLFKVSDVAGRNYFVSHDMPDSIAKHVKAWFGSKAEDLYEAADVLERHNIPTVKYPGWGKNGTETMAVSEEVPESMTALEYWFRVVPGNNVLRIEFLSKLSDLIGQFYANSVVINNFSLKNILVRSNGSEMVVFNAYDVEEREGALTKEDKIGIIRPFVEMRGEITADNATIAILDSGIVSDSQEASELWDEAVDQMDEYIENEYWPENEESFVEDEYTPLCRTIEKEGCILHVRNTIWQKELPPPDDTNSIAEEVPEEDAGKIWLNSLKAQLMRDPIQKLPVAWEHYEDGRKDVIRYASTSEAGYDAGFVIQ